MKLSNEEIKQYQQQALYYCDMALNDMAEMAKQYTLDCNTEKVDLVGTIIIPPLVNVYYSVKKGIISREDAVKQQKGLFSVIDVED